MNRLVFLLVSGLVFHLTGFSQERTYKIGCIGFYNLENLFDTLDTPDVLDTEFTPEGPKLWSSQRYQEKLDHLARVISALGTEKTPDGVALLGVSEIENRSVLEDLIMQPALATRNYQIVHFDSPDLRGVDVGLLYQPKYFQVTGAKSIPLVLYNDDGSRRFTRDVLYVSGLFDGEPLHVLVNHWPSRSGGEKLTQPGRNAGAALNKMVVDSLVAVDPAAKIIIMGDLNDDPVSPSVKAVLKAAPRSENLAAGSLFNPMYSLYKKGIGSLAYRDAWSLFDQLIISSGATGDPATGYSFYQAIVFNQPYLIQPSGQYKGYPYRSFVGDNYTGGYSDHFPVYLFFIKAVH